MGGTGIMVTGGFRVVAPGATRARHLPHVPTLRRPVRANTAFSTGQRPQGRPVEGPPADDRRPPLGPVRRRPLAQPPRPLRALADRLRPLPQVVPQWPVGQDPPAPPSPQDALGGDRLVAVLH